MSIRKIPINLKIHKIALVLFCVLYFIFYVHAVLANTLQLDIDTAPDDKNVSVAGNAVELDPDIWYASADLVFNLVLPDEAIAMAVEISSSTENNPELNKDAIYESPEAEFRFTGDLVEDGIQYLNINFKNQEGWGVPINHKIQIDTTAPEPFSIIMRKDANPSSFPTVIFDAFDSTSGIDYYEITIAEKGPFRVMPDEAGSGYLLRELEDGTYTIKIVAYDKAGNSREITKPVLITAGWINPLAIEEQKLFWSFLTPINILIFFLLVIIMLLLTYIWCEQKRIRTKEEKLRRETREVQDQMEKIFSALRDEIYDQINMITKRKRLSKSEKEALEGLNQALEVSETLIEKEINDVKVILK